MKGHGHDSVCEVKGFLDAIAMVNVYVNVKNPGVVPWTSTEQEIYVTNTVKIRGKLLRSAVLLEELQYTDDDVIDIAKPRGLHQHKNQKRHLTQMSWTEKTHINACGFVLTSNFLAWCKPPAQFIAMSQIWKIKQSHTFNWPRSWRPWQF